MERYTCHPVRERILKWFDVCGSSQVRFGSRGLKAERCGYERTSTRVEERCSISISMTVGDESSQHCWLDAGSSMVRASADPSSQPKQGPLELAKGFFPAWA